MADDKRIEIFEIEIKNLQSIDELNKQLAEAKKSYKAAQVGTEEYIKAQEDIVSINKKLSDHKNALKTVEQQSKLNDNTIEGLRAKYNKLNAEIVKTDLGTGKLSKEYLSLNNEARKVSDRLKELEGGFGQNNRNVGNYTASIKEAIAGTGSFGSSFVNLGQVLLTNPIGLIVTALAGLVALFQQNDDAAAFFSGVMKGLGAAVSLVSTYVTDLFKSFGGLASKMGGLSTIIADVGTRLLNSLIAPFKLLFDIIPALSALVDGEFSKAFNIGSEAVINAGKSILFMNDKLPPFVREITDAVAAGVAFKNAMEDLEEAQSKSLPVIAKLNQTIAVQEKAIRNTTLSYEEQIKILDDIQKTDEERAKIKLALIDQEIAANQKYLNALGEGSTEQEGIQFKLNELEAQRLEAQTQSLALQEKYDARREQFASAEAKRLGSLLEKEQEFLAFRQLATDTQLTNLDTVEGKTRDTTESEAESLAFFNNVAKEDLDKNTKATEDAEKKKAAAREAGLSTYASVLGQGAALAEEGSDLQKGLAIGETVINTYKSAMAAFSSLAGIPIVGPALGFAAAAATTAFGIAQVANIAAAAGGGDFVTTKPTLLLVGDNPGGRERVTVEPLSGKGKTRIGNSGLIAMAGGGSLTVNPSANNMQQVGNTISSDTNNQNFVIKSLSDTLARQATPVVSVVDIKKVTNKTNVTESRATLSTRK